MASWLTSFPIIGLRTSSAPSGAMFCPARRNALFVLGPVRADAPPMKQLITAVCGSGGGCRHGLRSLGCILGDLPQASVSESKPKYGRYVNAQTSAAQMPPSTGPNDLPSLDANFPTDLFYFPYPCSRLAFSVGLAGSNAGGCSLIRRLFKLKI